MLAIISDIHGNLEALQTVLADMKEQGAEVIICLGDLVGYGPDPLPCLELAMEWSVVVLGNHEQAALSGDDLPDWSSYIASQTIFRFRRDVLKQQKMQTVYPFMRNLPRSVQRDEALYVHGSPREPTNEYVFPEDIFNDSKMTALFARFTKLCFCGHTHIPGVFMRNPHRRLSPAPHWSFVPPEECNDELTLGNEPLLCNVGSVGQPRDGDPRACYVLLDGRTIRFRKLQYDIAQTMHKLRTLDPPEDAMLADRLAEGR